MLCHDSRRSSDSTTSSELNNNVGESARMHALGNGGFINGATSTWGATMDIISLDSNVASLQTDGAAVEAQQFSASGISKGSSTAMIGLEKKAKGVWMLSSRLEWKRAGKCHLIKKSERKAVVGGRPTAKVAWGDDGNGSSSSSPPTKQALTPIPLPFEWALDSRSPGNDDRDAASIRSNVPIPKESGIYYFEVTVVSKGRSGWLGIGICEGNVNLNRLPGWDKKSWGYHGDDGCSFTASGHGKKYGPTYTTGDVIGCRMNFTTMSVAFTKNGMELGNAFEGLDRNSTYYATIGMRTMGEILEANFGQKPFRYDIDTYVQDERARLWSSIHSINLVPPTTSLDELSERDRERANRSSRAASKLLHPLIQSYLVHNGVKEEDGVRMDVDGEEEGLSEFVSDNMRLRQDVKRAILGGDISMALNLVQKRHPTLLSKNPRIHFALLCSRRLRNQASVIEDDDEDSDGDIFDLKSIELGSRILSQFDPVRLPELRPALDEIFSLMAYADVTQSPSGFLINDRESGREAVCSLLDKELLAEAGEDREARLEVLTRQAIVVGGSIQERGMSLIDVWRDILDC
ncbi:hypothetical protein BC829DRAFT_428813 [Chytridium lagenaria]|nr:hypothetical protein BC829DRAFT_428813 [Chytridium lagenaria]